MKEQNFKNHRQVVYSYYLFTGVPILVLIIMAVRNVLQDTGVNKELWVAFLLVGWILLTMLFRARGFAILAQDRAIRAEESLRHFQLTGKPLDARFNMRQVIALRFASDAELPLLAEKAADNSWSPIIIKKEIREWRPDLHRV
ncbi:MAG: DUF6526 family protein [Chitinophagaceae bacterium]